VDDFGPFCSKSGNTSYDRRRDALTLLCPSSIHFGAAALLMTKRKIKVIKRDAEPEPVVPPTAEENDIQRQKDEADDHKEMVAAVEDWISERRENKKVEDQVAVRSLFSDGPSGTPSTTTRKKPRRRPQRS
jgi:hypothetical protein